jgi:hypothetical protein
MSAFGCGQCLSDQVATTTPKANAFPVSLLFLFFLAALAIQLFFVFPGGVLGFEGLNTWTL